MGDLIRLSMLMVRRNKLPVMLVFSQFLIVFLLLMLSLSMLWDYNKQTRVLEESMGKKVWVLYASVKDSQKYLQEGIEFPNLWTEDQLSLVKKNFGDRTQYAYVDMNEEKIVATPGFRTMYLSTELFNHLAQALGRDGTEWLYMNQYHQGIHQVMFRGNKVRLETDLRVRDSLYKSLFIPSYSGTDFILVPDSQGIGLTGKKDNNFSLFLYEVSLQEIAESGLLDHLDEMNKQVRYELRSPVEYTAENIDQFRTISKIVLVFTVSMLFVFFPGVVGFIMLQFEKERGKLALYVAFGATRSNITTLLLNWNLVLLGIPFFTSVLIFTAVHRMLLDTDFYGPALLTGGAVFLILIGLSIMPLRRMSTENMLIQELKGDI